MFTRSAGSTALGPGAQRSAAAPTTVGQIPSSLDAFFLRTLQSFDPRAAAASIGAFDSGQTADQRNVWWLAHLLLADRINRKKESSFVALPSSFHSTAVVSASANVYFREAVLVRQWLEDIASRDAGDLEHTVGPHLSQIPLGAGPALEEALRYVWAFTRRGQIERAAQFLRECGSPVFAALLPAPVRFTGASPSDQLVTGLAPLERAQGITKRSNALRGAMWSGNGRRALLCQIAQSTPHQEGLFTQAWYGLLGDDLMRILPACKTWYDHLWAHLFVLTSGIQCEQQFEARGRALVVEALNSLAVSPNDKIKREATEFHANVMTQLVLGDADDYRALVAVLSRCPEDHIKFSAHLLIYLMRSSLISHEVLVQQISEISSVLKRHVHVLIQQGQFDVIADFVAEIPHKDDQISMYVAFLSTIAPENPSNREFYLQLAEQAGLDVRTITLKLVDDIIQAPTSENVSPQADAPDSKAPAPALLSAPLSGSFADVLASEDKSKIDAFEWMAFSARLSPESRSEVLAFANALARAFILDKSITALVALFQRIDTILPSLLADSRLDLESSALDAQPTHQALVREHLALRMYSQMHITYKDWYNVTLQRPIAPPASIEQSHLPSALVQQKAQLRQFDRDMESWISSSNAATHAVIGALKSIIFFPHGWLQSSHHADQREQEQLRQIRAQCLPECFLLWHRVLFESRDFSTCQLLADYLADPFHEVNTCFSESSLQTFLSSTKTSTIKLFSTGFQTFAN